MSPTVSRPHGGWHCPRAHHRTFLTGLCVMAAFVLVARSASAQDPFLLGDPALDEQNDSPLKSGIQQAQALTGNSPRLLPSERNRRGEASGSGIQGRFGHIAFPTFGRNTSITHLELLPWLRSGNNLWFSDVRMFLPNTGDFGGNFGLGMRHLDNSSDVIWGGNFFYDVDQTTGQLFNQVGFGIEAIGEIFGARANLYVPVGNTSMTFPRRIINQRFVGTDLVFDVLKPIGEAMTGGDLEFEAAVPGDWAREHALRLFVGAYYFQDSQVPDITGAKFAAQAFLFDHVATATQVTYDETFGPNATLGLTFYFPGGGLDKNWNRSENRLTDFVRRNYNIIVDRRATYQRDVVAMSPVSAAPLVFAHVGTGAIPPPDGNGPETFDTLADATAINPDVIFVHSGTVLTESIVLADGQQLLGEGVDHMISAAGYGDVMLPATTTGGVRPTLLNASGDAITLGEGSVVSGFIVQDPTGRGIVIDGLTSAGVFQTDIIGAGGNGLDITNVTGEITIEDVLIQNAAGVGLHVDNLSGALTAAGMTTIDDSGIAGLRIENSSGSAEFEELSITNTTSALGVDLLNNTGETVFDDLQITTDGGAGLQALTAGHVRIAQGDITSDNAAVLDLEDTDMDIFLDTVHSDGGALGVRLVDATGGFFLVGGNNFGSGGFLINKATAILLDNVESAFFNGLDFDANGTSVQSTDNAAVGFNGARFANTTGLTVDSLNDQFLQISQSAFTANGAGVGTIRYRADAPGDYSLLLSGNQINDADASSVIEVLSEPGAAGATLALQASNNQIQHDADNSVGMNVDWNGALTASISSNQFGSSGDAARALLINAPATTDASILTISGNSFLYSGNNIVAAQLTTAGPLSLRYQSNLGIFTGSNSTGLEATFDEVVNATISANRLEHQGGGGTSILLNDVVAGSSFSIENNVFIFPDNGPVVERGIIFSNVTGAGMINVFGSLDNSVINATQPFFVPAATTIGTISVNGSSVP